MDAIGGGVLVAVAAALWVAYLLPTWFRRGQYLATERNAVRLQQTLRILAETAETPEEVRVEATARDVAAQQRILAQRSEQARLEAEAAEQLAIAERAAAEQRAAAAREKAERALAAKRRAEAEASVAARSSDPVVSRRALRRRRAACSLGMLVSVIVVVVGAVGLPFGLSPFVAAAGLAGAVAGFAGVAVLARRRVPVAAAPIVAPAAPAARFEPIDLPEPVTAPATSWTPQPLPKPLHLSRGTIAAAAMASVEAAEGLRRAAVDQAIAERAAKLEPELPKLAPRAVPAAPAASASASAETSVPANPYARMGLVGDAEPGFEGLDAVLRRRREAV
ncbi:hypothetical protein [Agromyces silvae]|uniref:hypothetical protein n=1 Tax=Agromyces silvae TaxID=3388266 RepID=UPI00280AE034|nr:hypothetical protein [Agromyces protaetiae]